MPAFKRDTDPSNASTEDVREPPGADPVIAAMGAAGPMPSAMPERADALGIDAAPAAADGAPAAAARAPAANLDRWFVTAALMLVMVLASMEMTVTSTAMPTIIGELRGLEHYAWVASIYLLACTVTMPLYGRLADAFGRKRTIVVAVVLFTVGSVLAAYARTMPQLIAFRGVQGLGAGGIMPVVLTILADLFTLKERAKIQGAFSAVWGLSSLAGPALGAAIVHGVGWRWVFLVNLPFGVLGLLVLIWKYRDDRPPHPHASAALDLPGIALLAVASGAMLTLVSRLGPGGWSAAWIVGLGAASALATLAFLRQERRSPNPVMPPSLILSRDLGPAIAAMFFFGAGFLCLDTYVPLYVQGGLGGTAADAAAVVTPVMLTWALSNVVVAPLLVRWGFRSVALIGAALVLVGFVGLWAGALFGTPRWALTAVLAVTGVGFGASSMSYLLGAQDAAERHSRGIVTSSISFFRTIGGAMGVGLLGAAFNALAGGRLDALAARGVTSAAALDPKLQGTLPPDALAEVQLAIASSLVWVFAAMVALAVAQFVFTLQMRPKRR